MPSGQIVDPLDVLPSGAVTELHGLFRSARSVSPVLRLGLEELAAFPGAADFNIGAQLNGRDHAFVCLGRDEVMRVMRETATFSSASFQSFMGDLISGSLSLTDGEEHRRLRALVGYAFQPAALERWRSDIIVPLANRLIDDFIADGRAELNAQFAIELPIQVIAAILGLPAADYGDFRTWAFDILLETVEPERARAAAQQIKSAVAALMLERRGSRGGDLISDLAIAEIDGGRLQPAEIADVVVQLVVAGNETTFRGLGTVMFALLTEPDQFELVLEDRSLIPQAIEESLRWEPPLPLDVRTAVRATTLGDFELEPGDVIMVSLASANRDEKYCVDAERFDLRRRPQRPHVTFARGPHTCLGSHLARMELNVSVETLLERLRGLRLDPQEPPPFMRGALVRGPSRVPVVFDRATERGQ